jgi:hypothetical protein
VANGCELNWAIEKGAAWGFGGGFFRRLSVRRTYRWERFVPRNLSGRIGVRETPPALGVRKSYEIKGWFL